MTEDLKKENIYLVSNSEVTPEQLQFIQSFYKEKLNGLIVPVWFSAVKLLDYENDENIYLAVKVSKNGNKPMADYRATSKSSLLS